MQHQISINFLLRESGKQFVRWDCLGNKYMRIGSLPYPRLSHEIRLIPFAFQLESFPIFLELVIAAAGSIILTRGSISFFILQLTYLSWAFWGVLDGVRQQVRDIIENWIAHSYWAMQRAMTGNYEFDYKSTWRLQHFNSLSLLLDR